MRPKRNPGARGRIVSLSIFLSILWLSTLHLHRHGLHAQDWTQWRGSSRDGTAAGFKTPREWPKSLQREWSTTVGEGHSSPVVAGSRVYLHSRQRDEEIVRCLELDSGKQVWQQSYSAPYKMNSAAVAHGKGPKATPTLRGGRLYTFGISGILSCFDARTGRRHWRHDVAGSFPKTSPLYGTAASPLVESGLCIVPVGGHDNGALMAFDASSGETRWSWKGDGPAYSSPIDSTLAGTRQVIVQMQRHLVGLELKTGELLWKTPFRTDYDQNAVTPVVYRDSVIHSGFRQPTQAVKVTLDGASMETKVEWTNEESQLYMSSPVIVGNLLFVFSHRRKGQLCCLDARSGKTLWQGPPRSGDNAAIVIADDVLLVLTTDGRLTVVKTTAAGYDEIAKYRAASTQTWAHPAVVGRRILVKDETTLASWRLE